MLSTFIPNYNHGHCIERALEGVMAQSVQPGEVVIYDDGSTDDSVQVIRKLQKRWPVIRLVEGGVNRGALIAGRMWRELVDSTWLHLLAADDAPLPGYFEKAMRLAKAYPDAGVICGPMRIVHEVTGVEKVVGIDCWRAEQYVSPRRFLDEYMMTHAPNHSLGAGTLWRRDALVEVGGFREDLLSWSDTFAARAMALKYGACYIPDPVVRVGYAVDCYSARISRDMSVMLRIINNAESLMRSPEYRDRFPAEYVYRWKRDYLLLLQKIQAQRVAQDQEAARV